MDSSAAATLGNASKDEREQALSRTREMIRLQRHGRRDRWPPVLFGSSYVLVSLLALTQLHNISIEQVAAICLLLPVYVVAQRLGLDDDGGSFVLTQPIVVVMLFLVPLAAVPAVVLVGAVAGAPRDPTSCRRIYKLFHSAMNGWFCIGPVLVFAVAGTGDASHGQWPVYLLALLAQFAFDGIVGIACCLASGGSVLVSLRSMMWTDVMDTLLASIGLTAVIATGGSLWAIAFASAPIGMLILVTRDRRTQVARAVALTDAFDEVVEESRVDALTTLANRRKWSESIDQAELRRLSEPGLVVTALVADIDGLKLTNDRLGHQAGDELIRAAATLMEGAAPRDALVARLGGDEFGMLIVHRVGEVVGEDVVARIRSEAARRETVSDVQLSMSVGCASCPPATSVQTAIDLADEHTLEDKRIRKVGRAS
jgi:diguanylate cyclase (GGDEF)-like protein